MPGVTENDYIIRNRHVMPGVTENDYAYKYKCVTDAGGAYLARSVELVDHPSYFSPWIT